MSNGTLPAWPCPLCNATGERVGQECHACDGDGEIVRGFYEGGLEGLITND